MAHDGQDVIAGTEVVIEDLLAITKSTLAPVDRLLDAAKAAVRAIVSQDGKVANALVEENQTAAHGLAWLATYAQSLHQMQLWAEKLQSEDKFTETEQLIHQIAFGEYLCQMTGGIQMNQGEILRLHDLGVATEDQTAFVNAGITSLQKQGNTQAARTRLVELMQEQSANITVGRSGLDEELEMIREQFRRYAVEKVEPFAHEWHLKDELIPIEVINELAEMGVFGLTIPEEYGGFGLSKASMCVVSEELSRGYIGVGSLGTRSEIAAELIIAGGTDAQKEKWLPRIASAETLPTAVFTEPNTGSDLGSLRTRAVKDGDDYKVTGNKTWITHAARTHVMTLLARTDPQTTNYKGLSMFLAEKTPGDDANPFPSEGMTGGEIEVLGYRGMKEYELAFDGFHVKGENLLGGEEGKGFKQLMETFESARIQTAARAIGVAQSALDISMQYAIDRKQFGKSLINFPRVSSKLAMMAVEIMIARQLTYFSAFEKDEGRRCDVEAGMAKLLGARVAWAAADNGLQIHGGNGFALEYKISRVLCDARILNIFEGAAEIQAQVISRRLLG
ncbi:MAG: acyl-CoA/acyl-ACP dehydrogenase [Sulfitobacter litoralis]|jgi:(2S)-methylsuccinyl-CoA dehydrogenase|uniref:(2S)-methylsuccinyl-CoA dehydrogenase n=1 Tax=Sulfitobacter litoralis TaxID=335975 RepID=A0ABY0RNF2_9RHOB|nr:MULTISPECIES: acyl-CoA dehydrogenase family protein [Sulfitobacter]MBQ0717185.1 acyl-CoA/acyl-ACP dehydrogenase [Sulfitobacter litoralis]MBQ0764988.1 acyl-CoA/acyl-ACP dehydrogenase [Sulfitobacter litoralis]MBQ0800352.1 acyl-CoA/acyl-ACP dehydrogenase [Sulfitobacter litoralis]MCF7727861.1 acyl-CoA dehydrogenase [Sulfitobacter sp. M22]MCF7776340.1 acyl-CoA dehydrogenase [Sulfitobacter sp. M220]|tara:strand:+ start:516 stop:2201 length:1686 start_codon:yes stop_codon:yes gene_type:complete